MPEILTNRLSFFSNSTQILNYLRSPHQEENGTPFFSLESIRSTPKSLKLIVDSHVRKLSVLNSDLSGFDEKQKELILKNLGVGAANVSFTKNTNRIENAIEEIRSFLGRRAPTSRQADTYATGESRAHCLESAITNFRQLGFFSYIDWRLAHWGTVDDVCSVVEDTFNQTTECVEFQTKWTSPVAALQHLADTFPSVRFELSYRFEGEDPWTKVELFPTVPFGY